MLELLLLDAGNPRSLAYQLWTLARGPPALPDASGTALPDRLLDDLGRPAPPQRRCALDKDDRGRDVRGELTEFLDGVHDRTDRT